LNDKKDKSPDLVKNRFDTGFFEKLPILSKGESWLQALKITSIYFLISSLWIIMSDKIVSALFTNQEVITLISIAKGWLFVLVTSTIIFRLISKEIKKVIESRKNTEQLNAELEKSNTLFTAILESSPEIMVFSLDCNYCYTAFNNRHKYSMLRLWGREIRMGDNILEVISSQDESEKSKASFDRALSGDYFTLIENYGNDKNPQTHWQNYYSPILAKDRSVIGITCFVLNITALKRAQDKNLFLSYHDNLTGLYNRRYYEDSMLRIDTERNLPISIIIADINGLKIANDAFGHLIGDEMLRRAAESITGACRADDIVARWGGDEFIVLLPKTTAEQTKEIVARIRTISSTMTVNAISIDISLGWSTKIDASEEIRGTIKNAEDYMYKNKINESKSMRSQMIKTIMNILHKRSHTEELHSKRVGEICQKIGIALHLPDSDINTLNLLGFLHDIGKIAIQENILKKPGTLTETELELVRQHSEIGWRIIRSPHVASEVADAILSHHESWDGTGYPKGLKGEDIPMFARIINIADSFDAMTSARTYRETWTTQMAAEEILRCAGTRYDPEIAKIFVDEVLTEVSALSK